MYSETNLIKQVRQFQLIARRYRKSYAPGVLEMVKLRWAALLASGLSPEELTAQRERVVSLINREYTVYDAEGKPTAEETESVMPLPEAGV